MGKFTRLILNLKVGVVCKHIYLLLLYSLLIFAFHILSGRAHSVCISNMQNVFLFPVCSCGGQAHFVIGMNNLATKKSSEQKINTFCCSAQYQHYYFYLPVHC